ncbi:MAG: DUF177 domain-containing protein [Flavobacteriales bacterium]
MEEQFIIPVYDLSDGTHHYEFKIDKASYFELYKEHIIDKVNFFIDVELKKVKNCFDIYVFSKGEIETDCDRCGVPVSQTIQFEKRLYVQHEERENKSLEDGLDLIELKENGSILDLSKPIYDHTILSIPIKCVHAEGECDKKVIGKLEENNKENDNKVDPRWEALKKFKRSN